jgi:hypothetical protein
MIIPKGMPASRRFARDLQLWDGSKAAISHREEAVQVLVKARDAVAEDEDRLLLVISPSGCFGTSRTTVRPDRSN